VGAALAQREADVSAEQPAATAWPGSVEEALAALEKAYVAGAQSKPSRWAKPWKRAGSRTP
jgi:hypothetical protein